MARWRHVTTGEVRIVDTRPGHFWDLVVDEKADTLNAHYHQHNDPYQFARDNNLGLIEGQAVKYVARHKAKGGKRDLLACLGAVTRLLIDEYGCGKDEALKAVVDVFDRKGL